MKIPSWTNKTLRLFDENILKSTIGKEPIHFTVGEKIHNASGG